MPGGADSVKVAVRVRPFNQREKNAGSGCIISMKGDSTTIKNPENSSTKIFSFDYSYWSHDGCRENEDGVFIPNSESSNYTDQRRVFQDLGQGVLDNAWQGYNAALFAYGQTGSGKSYSMIGYGPNKGIVPITCEELFKAIETNKENQKQLQPNCAKEVSMEVSFSMLEIYNERVKDLLVKGKQSSEGLKIRQNPQAGFYVDGLKNVPVSSYKEIEKLMEQGTVNRTTASTNMNATSSRSHMVITIRFNQVIRNAGGESNTRSSDINLVDLAGSERADSTGATGDRLKEGSAINQSLSTLGNVISALADIAGGKKNVLVPYRNSVLTKLLQSALGGNSRTIMIAALSPADINYDETLSTLRYADRAKKIQNKAIVNESPTDRLIRELKEENARLMAALGKGGSKTDNSGELQRLLRENESKMSDINKTWEQRLEEARKEWERGHGGLEHEEEQAEWRTFPYFTNINEDTQLSGVVKLSLHVGETLFGRSTSATYSIRGLGIQEKHALITNSGSRVTLEPVNESKIYVNGVKLKSKEELHHLSRIKFGSSCLYLYVGQVNDRKPNDEKVYDYDFFMAELAEHRGVAIDLQTPRVNESMENLKSYVVFQDFMDLLPQISEANAISLELDKGMNFQAEIKTQASHDSQQQQGTKEVQIKATNEKTKKVWVWSREKFLHRKDLMEEMYCKYMDGEILPKSRDKDPFWDPVEDMFLGSCHVMLQSLTYCVETDEHFTLHNYHGKEEAVMKVRIFPLDEKGHYLGEESIVEPRELLGKPFSYEISIPECMGVRWCSEERSRGVYCKVLLDNQQPVKSQTVWGKSYCDFNLKYQVKEKKVRQEFIDYLQTHSLVVELWGSQVNEEDQIHHTFSGNGVNGNSDDVLSQMKNKEYEIERLNEDINLLKKENFNLKKKLDKQQTQLDMKKHRRASGDIGLDADLAQALRVFFKDMKAVQGQISELKDFVKMSRNGSSDNGNLKQSLGKQEVKLQDVENKMSGCVASLKDSVTNTLRKAKR
ncbi:kinesin-like protein KIF28P isoform X3 [Ostrea edulis]|uniref:kinesin-like protein KIF28P isoform X3 n=1 Tax=Ostrea edulis TaxID=37623 RepID=UPI0024AF2C82|nr:kinesin-like protein KIF28P isoform X3 [Ostrea edulis]